MELDSIIKQAVQDGWRQPQNTTMNDMVGWILNQILPNLVADYDKKIEDLKGWRSSLSEFTFNLESMIEDLQNQIEELKNGKDGGIPQPKGRPSTSVKVPNVRA